MRAGVIRFFEHEFASASAKFRCVLPNERLRDGPDKEPFYDRGDETDRFHGARNHRIAVAPAANQLILIDVQTVQLLHFGLSAARHARIEHGESGRIDGMMFVRAVDLDLRNRALGRNDRKAPRRQSPGLPTGCLDEQYRAHNFPAAI
jgi:hypothetical protein